MQDLWNTFDAVRADLARQYQPMSLAEDTGLAVPKLEARAREYVDALTAGYA